MEGKALPVIEIAPLTGFYDYKNKYQAGSTIETCPADLPSEVAKRMQQHAEEACAAVSIQSYARVDFMLDTVTILFVKELWTELEMWDSLQTPSASRCGDEKR